MAQEQLIQRIDKMQKGSKSESIDVPMRIVSEQIQYIAQFLKNN